MALQTRHWQDTNKKFELKVSRDVYVQVRTFILVKHITGLLEAEKDVQPSTGTSYLKKQKVN